MNYANYPRGEGRREKGEKIWGKGEEIREMAKKGGGRFCLIGTKTEMNFLRTKKVFEG